MSNTDSSVRPTKRQRELLTYIEAFILEHGYSPSYREIMSGLQYTSVATVALHVTSLIKRGHLRKRDRSARSLEVVASASSPSEAADQPEKWLISKIEQLFGTARDADGAISAATLDQLSTIVKALEVLRLQAAAQQFKPQLEALAKRSMVAT